MERPTKTFCPDRVLSYFRVEWLPLTLVTVSGLVYNIGLLATPWFEGRLAQCLADILSGSETAARMALLVLAYILTILVVLCAALCQQHQPPDERHPVCQSGAAEPDCIGAGGCR